MPRSSATSATLIARSLLGLYCFVKQNMRAPIRGLPRPCVLREPGRAGRPERSSQGCRSSAGPGPLGSSLSFLRKSKANLPRFTSFFAATSAGPKIYTRNQLLRKKREPRPISFPDLSHSLLQGSNRMMKSATSMWGWLNSVWPSSTSGSVFNLAESYRACGPFASPAFPCEGAQKLEEYR